MAFCHAFHTDYANTLAFGGAANHEAKEQLIKWIRVRGFLD